LVGYIDSDWAGCAADRKSTSGCCFGLGSGLVSWFSRKQKSVALSSAEGEYMATSQASGEAIWLRKMLVGLCNVPDLASLGNVANVCVESKVYSI
jgi:hypothetical protein